MNKTRITTCTARSELPISFEPTDDPHHFGYGRRDFDSAQCGAVATLIRGLIDLLIDAFTIRTLLETGPTVVPHDYAHGRVSCKHKRAGIQVPTAIIATIMMKQTFTCCFTDAEPN